MAVARLAGRWCSWLVCPWHWLVGLWFLLFPFPRTPSQGPAFQQVSPSFFWDFGSLHQNPESAGHFVENSAVDQMVGSRRSPGATILGGASTSTSSANHRFSVPPNIVMHLAVDSVRGWLVQNFQTGTALRRHFLRAVAAAVWFVHRCGNFGFVSRHKPAEYHVPMFLQLQTLRRHVSRAERRCGIVVSLQSRRRRWASLVGFVVFDFRWRNSREATPISKPFQFGSTTFALQSQPLFVLHDTLHWPRASSFQLPWRRDVGSVLSC